MRGLVVMGIMCAVSLADISDRRDRRMERAWKGDIGVLEELPGRMARDRLQLHHRVRRFLSFPTGSVLTVTPKLTIPFYSELDGYVTGSQLYAFPIDLRLPNASLRLSRDYYDYDYDDQGDTMSYSSDMNTRRTGRALDDQRVTAFTFLERIMDKLGLDGRQCILRAVCEVGEEPVDDLGITGEVINLFFSAGYGSRTAELEDFVQAEEAGRQEGGCEGLYHACPYRLVDMVQSAFSYLYQGLAHDGSASVETFS
ncbi:uncharacterized protein [Panulirus ornatus]|uniref:uncharacterized protein n=1 Tax=Panulirus ornatus TaxID=150431 RepID=UPI003A8C01B8